MRGISKKPCTVEVVNSLISTRTALARRLPYWLMVIVGASATTSFAQRPIEVDPRLPRRQAATAQPQVMSSAGAPFTIVELSAPIQNLFDRAEEGVARSDWKFAIDSLQRIIDNPEGSLTRREDLMGNAEVYESARGRAIRRLASLPPEGISAYRLLYDGRAKGIFERAFQARDAAALRTTVQRYPLTAYADDAAELLASWALDEGRAAEAAALLEGISVTHPESDLPATRVKGKLAAAYARLGRVEDATAALNSVKVESAPQEEDSAWLSDVVAQITGYEDRLREDHTETADWPMTGGSPQRSGGMPAVTPALNREAPWSYDQQTVEYSYWARQAVNGKEDSLPLPAAQMVAAEGRLFIRTGRGCAALNADDLALIWNAPLAQESSRIRAELRRENGRIIRDTGELPGRTADDEVGGGIAVAHGLVFTIENFGQSGEIKERNEAVMLPRLGFMTRDISGRSTRLVAREVRTGAVRWSRGRGGEGTDPLGTVDFRGMPIPVGADLWVPYIRQNDLWLGVLDPRDGALRHNVLLCAVSHPQTASDRALYLAYADGVVYAASGHGAVFAVDVAERTPMWAAAYVETQRSGPQRIAPDVDNGKPRLSSAPIPVGGLVLVAPPDQTELFAFDRNSGEVRWRLDFDAGSYLVAARKDRFWIGGTELTCHQAIDRRVRWRKKLEEPATGRAILAGNRLMVPTLSGVSIFDAATGETATSEPLPYPSTPLGQLLALNHSLYSFDSIGVRRFVDLERLYPAALTAHEAAPHDAAAAVRLARLELLRGEARRARALLLALTPRSLEDGDNVKIAVAKTLVRASLTLALEADLSETEVLAVLDEAETRAWDTEDRVSCALAKADYLIQGDKYSEAATALWKLALSADAEGLRALGPAVTGQGRIVITSRLETILPKLDHETRAAFAQRVRQSLDDAGARLTGSQVREGIRQLRAIADLPSVDGSMELALLRLARALVEERGQCEAGEQLLWECRRRTQEKGFAAAALVRLTELRMALPFEHSVILTPLLDELERDFGDVALPATVDAPASGAGLRDWIAEKRAKLPGGASDAANLEPPGSFKVFDPSPAWTWQPNAPARSPQMMMAERPRLPRFVRFEQPPVGVLADRVLLFDDDEEAMLAVGLKNRAALWEAPLRRPGTFPDENGPWKGQVITSLRRAGADGQTGVICGHEGVFAVGLLTGKRLWLRPYETMTPFGHLGMREVTTAVGGGMVATMLRAGTLTALRCADGTLLWERDLRAEPVTYVRLMGEAVATLDDLLERVTLVSRVDGRLIKQLRFRQPDPTRLMVGLVHTGGVLCGPQRTEGGEDELVGYQVRTGEQAWRVKLDKPLANLFEPAEGFVGMALLGGEVRVLRAADGEVMSHRAVPGAQIVIDGVLLDGLFLTRHAPGSGGMANSELNAVDAATGEPLWKRGDIRALAGMTDHLRGHGGQLVVVVDYLPAGTKVKRVGLSIIDVRTGQSVGPIADLPQVDPRVPFDGEIGVWPDAVVVQIRDAMYGFALKPLAAGAGG